MAKPDVETGVTTEAGQGQANAGGATAGAGQQTVGADASVGAFTEKITSAVDDLKKVAESQTTAFKEALTSQDIGDDEAKKVLVTIGTGQTVLQLITAGWYGVASMGQILGQMATAHSHGCRNLVAQQRKDGE